MNLQNAYIILRFPPKCNGQYSQIKKEKNLKSAYSAQGQENRGPPLDALGGPWYNEDKERALPVDSLPP